MALHDQRSTGSPTQFVFVLGTGRCGSTMVQDVLAQHPDTGFVSSLEVRYPWLPIDTRWNGVIYRSVAPALARLHSIASAPAEAYRALDREVSPIISTPMRDLVAEDATPWLANRFSRFFTRRAETQRVPVFLHKFTGWPRAGFIRAVFPEARFIHILRDGRAVANSLLQVPWWDGYRGPDNWRWGPLPESYEVEWQASGYSFPLLAGLEWKILMDAFSAARQNIPDERWLEVRYEDILDAPRDAFETMLRFSGLPASADFSTFLSKHPFRRGRLDAFRRDLDARSLRLLNDSLGTQLEQHGYSL